jgi:prepilin-type N-terminal cleavage/methylation domain-containing protein
MQNFRRDAGFTVVELMTVVGIAGVLATIAISSLRSYARHEDTRRAAQSVAGTLNRARSEAVASGRMTFVVFGEPADGTIAFETNQVAAIVVDQDDDQAISAADAVSAVFPPSGINPEVTKYGDRGDTVLKTAKLPPLDESRQINPGDDMTKLTGGSSLPIDPAKAVPIVAFAPQGSPVSTIDVNNWGVGAGGMYLTDNDELLIGVIVQPLGDVRVVTYDPAATDWK